MRARGIWILALIFVLAPTGCVREPPPESPQVGSVPPPQEVEQNQPAMRSETQAEESFAEAYQRMGEPRMIVYATRPFTGQVNDWQVAERAVLDMDAVASVDGEEEDEAVQVTGEVQGSTMKAADQTPEPFTDDELLFERSFVAALVEAGVTVLDRDVILRQEALDHQDVDALEQTVLSETVVETYALTNNVDWIVTVDMLGESTLPCGERRFTTVVKGVETGEIRASADSRKAAKRLGRGGYRATGGGYQKVEAGGQVDCADLAEALARELLAVLAGK